MSKAEDSVLEARRRRWKLKDTLAIQDESKKNGRVTSSSQFIRSSLKRRSPYHGSSYS
jgi:hypothetical protein